MAKTVSLIGIDGSELGWVRMLVGLLRHPDPTVPELARHALLYLADAAAKPVPSGRTQPLNHAG